MDYKKLTDDDLDQVIGGVTMYRYGIVPKEERPLEAQTAVPAGGIVPPVPTARKDLFGLIK